MLAELLGSNFLVYGLLGEKITFMYMKSDITQFCYSYILYNIL